MHCRIRPRNRAIELLWGALYLFLINTLFISSAFITLVLGVPCHREISAKNQKRINHIIIFITTIILIPSIFAGGLTVYNSVIETNISSYLTNEFNFPDTQVVKSDIGKKKKVISFSLVGEPVSGDVIQLLRSNLSNYNLDSYTLRVTQSTGAQDSGQPDYGKLAANASPIFDKLSGCWCGVLHSSSGEAVVLVAQTDEAVSESKINSIKNWLITETGMENVQVYLQSSDQN